MAQKQATTAAELTRLLGSESGIELAMYRALLRMVRQNARKVPIGHDAIVDARRVLARASGRAGQTIDWAKEKMP